MRIDKEPFSDIRVRQAFLMATDFESILQDYRDGQGQIITYPFSKVRGYEDLYVGLDEPDFPEEARAYYAYNPDRAKELLKEAGYPNGLKTSIVLSGTATASIDYYSIVKAMWAKVGIDLTLDLKDTTVVGNIQRARSHEGLITNTTGPVAIFYVGNPVQGVSSFNLSMIDDPKINAAMTKLRLEAITDQRQAMKTFREEIFKYCLVQAYAIPDVIGTSQYFWWPWLRNYSGEISIGYDDAQFPQFIWIDQAMKKNVGY
jgi:peptide/nickel transport system substrate-binding protein